MGKRPHIFFSAAEPASLLGREGGAGFSAPAGPVAVPGHPVPGHGLGPPGHPRTHATRAAGAERHGGHLPVPGTQRVHAGATAGSWHLLCECWAGSWEAWPVMGAGPLVELAVRYRDGGSLAWVGIPGRRIPGDCRSLGMEVPGLAGRLGSQAGELEGRVLRIRWVLGENWGSECGPTACLFHSDPWSLPLASTITGISGPCRDHAGPRLLSSGPTQTESNRKLLKASWSSPGTLPKWPHPG